MVLCREKAQEMAPGLEMAPEMGLESTPGIGTRAQEIPLLSVTGSVAVLGILRENVFRNALVRERVLASTGDSLLVVLAKGLGHMDGNWRAVLGTLLGYVTGSAQAVLERVI